MELFTAFSLIFGLFLGAHHTATSPKSAINESIPVQEISVSQDATTPEASTSELSTPQAIKFAKCLTSKGTVMYGAYWCSHCQSQEALFGEAFQYIKYQECDAKGKNGNPKLCEKAGVLGYPTWKIPGHKAVEGTQTFEQLAQTSNCPLK